MSANMKKIDLAGRHWAPIVHHHNGIIDKHKFTNYRTIIADRYFFDPTGYWNKFGLKGNIAGEIQSFYDEVKNLGIDINIGDTVWGEPIHIEIDDKIITHDLLVTCEEIDFVGQHIDFNKIKSVVEIGGGYGRTAYGILMKYPHIKYKIVDIEPASGIAKYHLNKSLEKCNVEFLKPSDCVDIEDVDLWLSISTIAELDVEQIEWYVEHITRTAKYFYIKDRNIYNGKILHNYFKEWGQIVSQESRITNYMIDEIYSVRKND